MSSSNSFSLSGALKCDNILIYKIINLFGTHKSSKSKHVLYFLWDQVSFWGNGGNILYICQAVQLFHLLVYHLAWPWGQVSPQEMIADYLAPCDLFLLAVKSIIRHGLNCEPIWLLLLFKGHTEPTPLLMLVHMSSSTFNLGYLIALWISMYNVSLLCEKNSWETLGMWYDKNCVRAHMLLD